MMSTLTTVAILFEVLVLTRFTSTLAFVSPTRRSGSQAKRVISLAANRNRGSGIPGSLTSDERQKIMTVAVGASKVAGDLILRYADRGIEKADKSNNKDLVTDIDILCENLIQDAVLKEFPEHGFLGEESVEPGRAASVAASHRNLANCAESDVIWVVDPIDGTTNFVHSLPYCAPSIAVICGGEVQVAVIFDPWRDELFTAMKGGGAWLNSLPIRVGPQHYLADSIVALGSPPASESLEKSILGVDKLMPRVQSIRMLGSAALMLSWVACGRLTCYWEYDLSSWDVCAGALIILEAGGKVTDLKGRKFAPTTRKICASNGHVHGAVLSLLQEANVC